MSFLFCWSRGADSLGRVPSHARGDQRQYWCANGRCPSIIEPQQGPRTLWLYSIAAIRAISETPQFSKRLLNRSRFFLRASLFSPQVGQTRVPTKSIGPGCSVTRWRRDWRVGLTDHMGNVSAASLFLYTDRLFDA
jgi:hypothetical protein